MLSSLVFCRLYLAQDKSVRPHCHSIAFHDALVKSVRDKLRHNRNALDKNKCGKKEEKHLTKLCKFNVSLLRNNKTKRG